MKVYKTIAVISYQSQAALLMAKLRSEDIDCQLQDEHIVSIDPLASFAYGGIKLQVVREDIIKAIAILQDLAPETLIN